MKMTLLEMTQNILSAMDAEEVASISDTVESQQVAEEIKTTYYENLGSWEMGSRMEIVKLNASGDSTNHPNVLVVPDAIDHFKWIKYNNGTVAAPDYREVEYLPPEKFLEMVLQNTTQGNLTLVKDISTDLPYKILNDRHPVYWTTFDDENIVFDSFNSAVDSNLQEAKSMAYAEVWPTWTPTDAFTPDLPDRYFPMFLAEAKSACFINYKGVANSKEEQRSRRQKVTLQNNSHRYNEYKASKRNFGRS